MTSTPIAPQYTRHATALLEIEERAKERGEARATWHPYDRKYQGFVSFDTLIVAYYNGGFTYHMQWNSEGPIDAISREAALRWLGFCYPKVQRGQVAS